MTRSLSQPICAAAIIAAAGFQRAASTRLPKQLLASSRQTDFCSNTIAIALAAEPLPISS